MDSCQLVREQTKMEVVHLNQKQLATRWDISEATLERWRSEGIGPKFLKLGGRVLYRQADIEVYEESCLASSTKSLNAARAALGRPVRFRVSQSNPRPHQPATGGGESLCAFAETIQDAFGICPGQSPLAFFHQLKRGDGFVDTEQLVLHHRSE
jgi:predicted DNA-binding transcriptional regulator AlpA